MVVVMETDDNDGIVDDKDLCPRGIVGEGDDLDGDGCKDAEDDDATRMAPTFVVPVSQIGFQTPCLQGVMGKR